MYFDSECKGYFFNNLIVKTETTIVILFIFFQKFIWLVPENIDIGHCLIGDSKSMEFLIENNGGQGRFCFMLGEFCIKSADIDWDKVKKMELFFIIFSVC